MKTKEFIAEFFAQGLVRRGGNCASVALIKCAIGLYDKNVFDYQKNGNDYQIVLKNNPDAAVIKFPIILSQAEIKTANTLHGFKQQINTPEGDDYFEYACLCYAVMGKVCQLMRNYKQYSNALNDLNRGENADFIPQFLGLENAFQTVLTSGEDMTKAEFDQKVNILKNILLYSDGHAVFASEGIFDDHGEIVSYKEENYGFRYFRLPN